MKSKFTSYTVNDRLALNILIVDDVIYNILALKKLLSVLVKCKIDTAYNGQEAIDLIKSN